MPRGVKKSNAKDKTEYDSRSLTPAWNAAGIGMTD
jgi:hypothetical protein